MEIDADVVADWRLSIAEGRRRIMRRWFWTVAVMTLCVLIVGGATRLTHSGLSMVEWQPILGVVPPVTHSQWQQRFDAYQNFPEFQKLRRSMTLSEFKVIFYWEYLHRLLARSIGLVFLLPFAFFVLRGWMNRPLIWRASTLFGLGLMQGVMGWLMVASGLVDRPSVSHYRLAAHLALAFMIFGYAVWLARELNVRVARRALVDATALCRMKRGLAAVGVLLGLQVIYGAFVAGLKAGFFANTFPTMAGRLIPSGLLAWQPGVSNLFANPVTVQWMHRLVGTLLALAVLGLVIESWRVRVDRRSLQFAAVLFAVVVLQYTLGVLTLIHAVPVPLGVTHQAMAMVLFGVWLMWLHHALYSRPATERSR